MKITALLTSLALITLPTVSLAATCTGADFAGTWRIYTVLNSISRCTLIMSSKGVIASSSFCYLPDFADSVRLTGTLKLQSDCHITGSINANSQQRQIDAWVSKGKDSISGIGWKPGNVFTGNVFSGVKQ
ncbi:hypothetical protein [Crenothrix sp.]|uniref:hypothetical protein n=1 Tax=Crenothrix sp. TaxID=3100433 RepID=UPI00374D5EA7